MFIIDSKIDLSCSFKHFCFGLGNPKNKKIKKQKQDKENFPTHNMILNKDKIELYNSYLRDIESHKYLSYLDPDVVSYVNPMNGLTLLHVACWRLDYNAVSELLEFGANPFVRSSSGRTPVYYAAIMSKLDKRKAVAIIKLLMLHGDTTFCDYIATDDCTPFDIFVSS